jgi:type IV secretory pathway TrbL component
MLRYRLRTLLIVLALGPQVLAGVWWAIRAGALDDLTAISWRVPVVIGVIAAITWSMARVAAFVTKH